MKQLYSFGKAAMLMAAMTLSALVAQAQQIWPVQMDDVTMRQFSNFVVADFRDGQNGNYASPRNKTFVYRDSVSDLNSYGQTGYLALILNSQDQTPGMDYYLGSDTSVTNAATRLKSAIANNEGEYYLHFAIKSSDNASHTLYTFNDIQTNIHFSPYMTGWATSEGTGSQYYIAEFDRDGEWHEYYIPMADFASILATSTGSGSTGSTTMSGDDMILSITTNGSIGDELNLDAVYFCDGAMRKMMGGSDPISEQEESVNITIDGDFSDWYSLSENVVVNASYNDNNTSRNNLEYMQLCSDGDFLYFYFQYKTDSSVITYPEGGGSVTVCNVDSFRILLNLDDNSETGYYHEGFWSMSGADILISGSWKDNFATADVCTYSGTSAREWTWTAIDSIHGAVTACTPVDLSSTSGAIIEGSINLKMLPMDISSLQVGVMSENTSGAISGILPSPERDWSSGESVPQAFLYVPMSQPRLPETITGQCGDSIYWTLNMETGELVLSGQGEMWDLSEITPAYRMDDTPGSVLYLIVEEGIREISGYAFADLYNLTYASLPTTLQTIGISAFSGCSELALIDVPEGVTTIVDQAFLNCSKMATLTLPSTMETIGDYTFAGCASLQLITCGAYVPPTISESTFRSVSSETPLRVPSEAVALYQADSLWNYFTNIYSMNGGEVENGECGDSVIWRYYPQAQYLEISGSGAMWDFDDNSPSYADFRDEVKVVMVEAGVTHIGSSAFLDFNNLQGVSMDSSVTSLGTHVFDNCTTLQYVELPTAITFIPEGTFYNCVSLQGAAIPANVTGIGGVAFYNCNQIQMLMSQPTTPPSLDANVFDGVPSSVPVYVPYESLESYKADQGWSYFSNFIGFIGDSIIMPDTTIVDPQVIEGMCGDSIRWVINTAEASIDFYGRGAMWNFNEKNQPTYLVYAQGIRAGYVEHGITTIGDYAFDNFFPMLTIALPSTIESIGTSAFRDCASMIEITCEAVTPPAVSDSEVFEHMDPSVKVFVPKRSINAYKQATGWSYFSNYLPLESDTVWEETVITICGITITPGDSTSTEPIDLLGDSTIVYDPVDNTITLDGADWTVGEEEGVAINLTGSETVTIVLNDSSSILADTIIASTADIVIVGEGFFNAEGVVPIIGVPGATITFDSVNMHVRSVPTPQALRRRIKGGKRLDETGGPALSGFGSADFNKTNVSPSDAAYGPVTTTDENGEETTTNALYTTNEEGEQEVVTEFDLTAVVESAVVYTNNPRHEFDPNGAMFNVLGLPVDKTYKGIVIQNGQTFLLK